MIVLINTGEYDDHGVEDIRDVPEAVFERLYTRLAQLRHMVQQHEARLRDMEALVRQARRIECPAKDAEQALHDARANYALTKRQIKDIAEELQSYPEVRYEEIDFEEDEVR